MFLPVFDPSIDTDKTHEQQLDEALKKFNVRIIENSRVNVQNGHDEPMPKLKVYVKDKLIDNLYGYFCRVYLVEEKYLIIKDSTMYRNIHAYDLDGNWLWDIEPCLDQYGKMFSFFGVSEKILVLDDGKKYLNVGGQFIDFITELDTGKNTRIWKVYDDTNYK